MAKRIVSTPPELTRLQRLTDEEDRLILNYRLLWDSGRKLFSNVISKTVAQNTVAESGNVTALRGTFNGPDDGAGEPTSLQRLTGRESELMCAYRVMCDETKGIMDDLFSRYLEGETSLSENVISIRR